MIDCSLTSVFCFDFCNLSFTVSKSRNQLLHSVFKGCVSVACNFSADAPRPFSRSVHTFKGDAGCSESAVL